jgi:hypothetical protein
MKKILILSFVLVGSYFAWSQFSQPQAAPTADEIRLLSGRNNLLDAYHPAFNVTTVTAATHTLNTTNAFVFVRGEATVINHIIFPDCTNNRGRWFKIITAGDRSLAVLTNANSQSFEHTTNTVTTSGFSMSSNHVCDVISTGTNWFVLRSQVGNN